MKRAVIDYIVREQDFIIQDLSAYLKRHEEKEMLRLLVAGSVDDGKSTLIGRLLYDSHLIYKDHLESIYEDSKVFNTTQNEIDLSLLTDGLRAEREQGITIDVAYRYFSTEKKAFIICDAPGHEQYTRNMATGASQCDAALILVDAENGVKKQTRRHSLIATIMGIRTIIVVINKMDKVNYNQRVYDKICQEYLSFSKKINATSVYFIPISALTGENVVHSTQEMPWYRGLPLLSHLESITLDQKLNKDDFCFPVQYVLRSNSFFRGYAGSVVSGSVRRGDEVIVLPSKRKTKIKSIEGYKESIDEAFVSMPIVLTMEEELDIMRGSVLVKQGYKPLMNHILKSKIVWMNDSPLREGKEYLLKSNTQCVPVQIKHVLYKYDLNELTHLATDNLSLNDIGEVEFILKQVLVYDSFEKNRTMGAFVLIDRNSHSTSGAGIVLEPSDRQIGSGNLVFSTDRSENKQSSTTIWLTGLSGAGKSTISRLLEKKLRERGIQNYVLDGDELRNGLNSDLGFSPEDRSENIRRAAEVAKMMNNAGLMVIAAFISPYESDRQMAAQIIGNGFLEVYVDADIEVCKQRDPKGLYRKFLSGAFTGMTGIDAPYEIPQTPLLHLDTTILSPDESAEYILNYLFKEK